MIMKYHHLNDNNKKKKKNPGSRLEQRSIQNATITNNRKHYFVSELIWILYPLILSCEIAFKITKLSNLPMRCEISPFCGHCPTHVIISASMVMVLFSESQN